MLVKMILDIQWDLIVMKKNDLIVILIVIVVALLFFIVFNNSDEGQVANVYYDGKLILSIDLTVDDTYNVEGYNGAIVIVVKDNKIKVEEETSPLHICSKQGFVDNVNEPIICLPNKIVIELSGEDDLDAIIK